MKKLMVLMILMLSNFALAKTEKLNVIKVTDDDNAIVERPNGEKWLIELGIGCRLGRYEGKTVIGEYGIDPDSAGAKLILPDDGYECRVWGGEEIN